MKKGKKKNELVIFLKFIKSQRLLEISSRLLVQSNGRWLQNLNFVCRFNILKCII